MRASEILRNLADLIDAAEQGQPQDGWDPQQPAAALHAVPTSKFTPNTQEPDSVQDAGVFVPPLQAKLELLKKAVNVDNIYDQECTADGEEDLDRMQHLSGINIVATDEAASDEPLDV